MPSGLPGEVYRTFRRRPLLWIGFAAGLVACKFYFRVLTVEDLGWILGPSATFAGLLSDTSFFATRAGYSSLDGRFLIDRSCSGLNFFVLALLMGGLVGFSAEPFRLFRRLPAVLLMGFAATVFANGLRIAGAIRMDAPGLLLESGMAQLHPGASVTNLAGADMTHLMHGMTAYLVVYILYYMLLRRLFRSEEPS